MPESSTQSPTRICGTLDYVKYNSPDSGFSVLKIKRIHKPDFTAVGHMPFPRKQARYLLTGNWTEHEQYGWQFKFHNYQLKLPEKKQGIIQYLKSVMTGIGPVRAEAIVENLGQNTLNKISQNPEILKQFKFIKQNQIKQITNDLKQNQLKARFKALICRDGISTTRADRIWFTYLNQDKSPEEIVSEIKKNPYQLIKDIDQIGFITADKIALGLGVDQDSDFRLQSAVKHIIKEGASAGHVFLPFSEVYQEIKKLLNYQLNKLRLAKLIKEMTERGDDLVREGNNIYLKNLYQAEVEVARKILLFKSKSKKTPIDNLASAVDSEQEHQHLKYAPAQLQAIKQAINNQLSIITGGPGTGKTTIINSISNFYHKLYPKNYIYLTSPTGKAAKRLEKTCQRKAQTMHRLLKYSPRQHIFRYNSNHPLPGPGLLIVDEFSMCDLKLFQSLLAALTPEIKLVLVGDVNQLPSVGAGNVLKELIKSEEIPVTYLEFNYRQAQGSIVSMKANQVARGRTPELLDKGDFEFKKVTNNKQAQSAVIKSVKKLTNSGITPQQIQVLSPMYKGATGVKELNQKLQHIINTQTDSTPQLGPYRQDDRVMVVRNDYTKMIFNGNLGKVMKIEGDQLLVKMFERKNEKLTTFKAGELDHITLAYATTIHKAQGSEFPVVIIVLTKNHYIMLRRNLLYTGMTRARDKLMLVADPWAVRRAVHNNKVEKRYSQLAARLS